MKIKFSWNNLWDEVWNGKKMVKVLAEPWRDNLVLAMEIEDVSEEVADNIAYMVEKKIREELYSQAIFCRCDNYEEKERVFWDTISIPRDFGNVKEQKQEFLQVAREAVREMKEKGLI